MSANDNRLLPARYRTRYTVKDDRFTEYSSSQDVANLHRRLAIVTSLHVGERNTDSSVRTPPHRFELELFDSSFIWCDGRTLDADLVLENGLGSVHGYFVVCLIPHEYIVGDSENVYQPHHGSQDQDHST
jgi:hypothetical protein